MYAYDHAVAWNSAQALEVSAWQTSDGVWVCSHDQSTARMFGTNYDIPTTAWATMSGLTTTTGGYPILRLDTLLAKYGGKRVIIVDNKGSQDISGTGTSMVTLLNNNGGTPWYVGKSYYTASAWPTAMTSAGYKTLGYYYDADTPNIASSISKFDVVMEDQAATSGSWTTILSYGKPVLASVIATAAQKTATAALGAQGYMASGVVEVVPETGGDTVSAVTVATSADSAVTRPAAS
jgi:glycerophosphoryl diester phosphodiesterase